MTGTIVSSTSLADVRDLRRIDDGAAIGVEHPSGQASIYDVVNSEILWAAPPGATVEVADPDHVLLSPGTRVDVVRWRSVGEPRAGDGRDDRSRQPHRTHGYPRVCSVCRGLMLAAFVVLLPGI